MGEDRNEAGSDSGAASDESRPHVVETWKEDFAKPLEKLVFADAEITSYIGLRLTLAEAGFADWRAKGKTAKKYTDIVVSIDGVSKDFTFDEFKERLGF